MVSLTILLNKIANIRKRGMSRSLNINSQFLSCFRMVMAELPVIQSIRICSKNARYYSFPKSALTTTNITFCDKYLMTLDIFVVMLFGFMMFYKRYYNLVTKMRYSSLRLTTNRHKLIRCQNRNEFHFVDKTNS